METHLPAAATPLDSRPGRQEVVGALTAALDGLFGFALSRTRTRADAEELVQTIAAEVLRCWSSVEARGAVASWIWAIAHHVVARWARDAARDRVRYSTQGLREDLLRPDDSPADARLLLEEELGELRREVALLSNSYREVVVAHYLRGESYALVAERLGLSVPLVKWRLHEARRIMREGMTCMRQFGDLSASPRRLSFCSHGNWGPGRHATTLLRQNILLCAFRRPVSVAELSCELGVAAAFVEDELAAMVAHELLEVASAGRVRSAILVHTGEMGGLTQPHIAQVRREMAPILQAAPEATRLALEGSSLPWDKVADLAVWELVYSAYDSLMGGIFNYAQMPKHADGQLGWALAFEDGSADLAQTLSRSNSVVADPVFGSLRQTVYWIEGRGWEVILPREDAELVCRVALEGAAQGLPPSTIGVGTEAEEALARLVASGHLAVSHGRVVARPRVLTREEAAALAAAQAPLRQALVSQMEAAHQRLCASLKAVVPAHLASHIPILSLSLVTDVPPAAGVPSPGDEAWPYAMSIVVG